MVSTNTGKQTQIKEVKAAVLGTPELIIPLLPKENTEEIIHEALLYSKYAPSYLENIRQKMILMY